MAAASSVARIADDHGHVDELNKILVQLRTKNNLDQGLSTIEKIFRIAHDAIEITEDNFIPWRADGYDINIPAAFCGNKPFVWGYSSNRCPFIAIQYQVEAADRNANPGSYQAILTIFQRHADNGCYSCQADQSPSLLSEYLDVFERLFLGKSVVGTSKLFNQDFVHFDIYRNLDPGHITEREFFLLHLPK